MKITCPHCGARGKIDDKFANKKLKCPKCGERFTATDEAPETAGSPDTVASPESGVESQGAELQESPENGSPEPGVTEEQTAPPVETVSCSSCGNQFAADELIEFEGQQICAACKPAFLQKFKEGATSTHSGGLEAGMAGQYSFQIGEVISEAWGRVKGAKGSIIGAVFVMYAISYLLLIAGGAVLGMLGIDENNIGLFVVTQIGLQLFSMAVTAVFTGGLVMMGVRRAVDQPINFSMLFDGISRATPLMIAMVLQTIIISIGFMLLIIPGIYLVIGYSLTYPLIMEKGLGPWEAMEASRKAVHHSWFQIFGLGFLMMLICMVSSIPLGIGLIWSVPMAIITLGIVYRIVFGVGK